MSKPTKLTDEEILANSELVMKLVDKNFAEPRKSLVKKMLEGPVGTEYFSCPGSSKLDFHDCFPGGLCYHSLNVLKNLRKIVEALTPGKYSMETLIFSALFHDLGKVGDGVEPYYVPEESQWHRDKLGKMYAVNKKCVMMPTSERGLYVLQLYGVPVSTDEYLAIRLNDGMYPPENKSYGMHEPELALFVHWADRYDAGAQKD